MAFLLTVVSCENPGSFDRENPADPAGVNFDSSAVGRDSLQLELLDLNQIQISWPTVYGVEKYQLLRRQRLEEEFTLITEFSGNTDSSYTDQVPKAGSYFYQVRAFNDEGGVLTIDSDQIHSNWIEGDTLSFTGTKRIFTSSSPSFIMKTGANELLVHFLQSHSETPLLTKLNFSTYEWNMVQYNDLEADLNYARGSDFYPVDENTFLLIKKLSWGQEHLGYLCKVNTMECTIIDVQTPAIENHSYVEFVRLPDNSILITGIKAVYTSIKENYAWIYNPSQKSLTETTPPPGDIALSSLTLLNNGDIFGCQLRFENHFGRNCYTYNISTERWSLTTSMPLDRFGSNSGLNSIKLEDGRVLLFGQWEEPTNNIQIYNPDTDTWQVSPPTTHTTYFVNYHRFTEPIKQRANGNVLVLTNSPKGNSIYHIEDYFLEEFDPDQNEWVNTHLLPEHVEYVSAYYEISPATYLIIYFEDNGRPKSAYFYLD